MSQEELLARLDERFSQIKEQLSFIYNEQEKKNKVLFDFMNEINKHWSDIPHLEKKINFHIKNHWAWVGVVTSVIATLAGAWELLNK